MSSGTVDVETTNDERARDANGTSWTRHKSLAVCFRTQWTMIEEVCVCHRSRYYGGSPLCRLAGGRNHYAYHGCNFRNVSTLACEVSLMSADHLDMLVPGHFVSPSVMQCIAPAVVPPIDAITIASIRITNNGQDFTPHGAQFEYRPVPVVTSLHPYRGLEAGGNVVTVSGKNFADSGITCLRVWTATAAE